MMCRSFVLIAALLAGMTPVRAADPAYRPPLPYYPRVSGKAAGFVDGVLLNYGLGMKSGAVSIRASRHQVRYFYVAAPPITIDGKTVECPIPPRPGFVPSKDVCPSWPAYVKIGTTRVRVFYWHGRRYGKPTLVTNKLVVVRSPVSRY